MARACVLRFTDDPGEHPTHLYRKRHGHPEDILTNLDALRRVIDHHQTGQAMPGSVAAQFLFLDILWYALQDTPVGELNQELQRLLSTPLELERKSRYLTYHRILDSTTPIPAAQYLYHVNVAGRNDEWHVKVSYEPDDPTGTVQDVFAADNWEFAGALSEATQQFR